MSDGSTVAFFEAPELPPLGPPPHSAHDSLADWQAIKADAGATGRDMVLLLNELSRRRSHRRQEGLS